MFRGLLTTIYIDINKNITQDKIYKTLINFYKNDYFIKIMMEVEYEEKNLRFRIKTSYREKKPI